MNATIDIMNVYECNARYAYSHFACLSVRLAAAWCRASDVVG